MKRAHLLVALVAGFLGVAPPLHAFELLAPPYSCRGHEFLSTEAAATAGVWSGYHDSLYYGVRYVDLGGMTLVGGFFSGDLNRVIHQNQATQHHHFCLRKSSGDLSPLSKDTAAFIYRLFARAKAVGGTAQQTIKDGGVVASNNRTVYTRYFLLGAALHAIQDSFAHGYRSQVWGSISSWRSAEHYLSLFGGRSGTAFAGKYRVIRRAVLYPTPAPGTATHNAVYSESEGGNYWSDKIWNYGVCDLVRNHLGNLQPHAFAAYLASADFLKAFIRVRDGADMNQELASFFWKWFGVAGASFAGYGNADGLCTSTSCPRLVIPGEK
jgi:hypothetical protein